MEHIIQEAAIVKIGVPTPNPLYSLDAEYFQRMKIKGPFGIEVG